MCDCYRHECAVKNCGEYVPMHIADFEYPRTEFKVWCAKHLRQATVGAVLFVLMTNDTLKDGFARGWSCAIDGPSVGQHEGNAPNIAGRWLEATITRIDTLSQVREQERWLREYRAKRGIE